MILTGAPLRVHVMLGAGREAPDVQFARSVSPAGKCSLSTTILGSVSGTSAHHNNATLISPFADTTAALAAVYFSFSILLFARSALIFRHRASK